MEIRKPAVAGQFYGGSQAECLAEIEECLPVHDLQMELPDPIVAAIVPHAGWVFSGELAGKAFKAIKQANGDVDTFVIFGAAHRYGDDRPVVYGAGQWQTPLGMVDIDSELAGEIAQLGADIDSSAHHDEHSIEVQVPFIQHLFPTAKIVPIIVPISASSHTFGQRVGELIGAKTDKRVVCIASTDLTHYGPRYGFCPEGTGPAAIKWAHEVNDMRFIDLAVRMQADQLVEEAKEHGNACGPAATAATVAAAKAMGRICGVLLGHNTSNTILQEKFNETSDESVGYASIVY